MKIKEIILALVILTILVLISCQTNKPAHYNFFERMIGEWKLEDKPVIEKWSYADGSFQATVFFISGDEKKITEEIRIQENETGVYYEANVDDQNQGNSVLFKLTELTDNKIIFENKEHDFPQRITYEFIDKNELIASISGTMNKEFKEITFEYTRNQKSTN